MRKADAWKMTRLPNGWFVETWWDNRSKNWITQLKDGEGYQQGSADLAGYKDWAQSNHAAMVALQRRELELAGGGA